ncbi:MAG: hypothetical protein FJ144_27890 [Deltaproteobacteria bacterium]|nr:hypothetical protein [Deltaproteobacteria bacterium]
MLASILRREACREVVMEDRSWRGIVERASPLLEAQGFDVVHPFRSSWWDETVAAEERLPRFAKRSDCLALLIGNTRALWPHFVAALEREPQRREEASPLDRFVEERVREVLARATVECDVALRFAHESEPRYLPMQRLAALAGLAPVSDGRLSAHPAYGPWFALRAVAIFDVDGPTGSAPEATAPCSGCEAPCREAFEHALAVGDARSDHAVLRERWRPWLAVRDACPVGREWRYSEEQILYHYARRWS